MKYICLSFDDARSDTYDHAFPILKKYGLCATVNVISDFVSHKEWYSFDSAPEPMSIQEIIEWEQAGFEVACHGSTHKNTSKDVRKNIWELQQFGVNVQHIGFASPESYLTSNNISDTGIEELKRNGEILYIRTGIQVLQEGILYTFLSIAESISHSVRLYYLLNKRNIIKVDDLPAILPSVAIKDYTELEQILFYIDKMENNQAAILMFHSILPESDSNYRKDHYCWSKKNFDKLCMWLSTTKDVAVLTTYQLVDKKGNK